MIKITIGAIIQARTSSTRLPRKILKELPYKSGITVLENVIRRLKRSKIIDEIVIATTEELDDDEIVETAKEANAKWFRGSTQNVLERYYLAAKQYNLDIIVRVTSDCPCIDPEVVDLVIKKYIETKSDYVSNVLVRSFPHGLDVEVFTFLALKKAYQQATTTSEKEHVTTYIRSNPDLFKITNVEAPRELYEPKIRITLDTEEDYALLCVVYDYLYPIDSFFSTKDIIDLFKDKPWLKLINKKVVQKKKFNSLEEEIEEAIRVLSLQDLNKAKDYLKSRFK